MSERSVASSHESSHGETFSAWLIERKRDGWPEWWIAGTRPGFGAVDMGTWTRDAWEATRFETRDEASRMMHLLNLPILDETVFVCSHGFYPGGTDA